MVIGANRPAFRCRRWPLAAHADVKAQVSGLGDLGTWRQADAKRNTTRGPPGGAQRDLLATHREQMRLDSGLVERRDRAQNPVAGPRGQQPPSACPAALPGHLGQRSRRAPASPPAQGSDKRRNVRVRPRWRSSDATCELPVTQRPEQPVDGTTGQSPTLPGPLGSGVVGDRMIPDTCARSTPSRPTSPTRRTH